MDHTLLPPASQSEVALSLDDLPLACPHPKAPLSSGHPRVWLQFEGADVAVCPYCSTRYTLRKR